jgi:Zn-dependent protease with chaperone function
LKGQRGRFKRTKSRALLERLRDYQDDILRFMMETALADALLLIVGEQEASNSNKLSQYFSSHPSIKQRVEALK